MTSRPLMVGFDEYTPNLEAFSTEWAASEAAIKSLLGIHPTRAHVVP